MSITPDDIVIKRWSPTMLPEVGKIAIIGPTGTGKTTIAENLLSYSKSDVYHVFCPTSNNRKMYEKHIPSVFVYKDLDVDKLDSIIRAQRQINETIPNQLRPLTIIFDDCSAPLGNMEKKFNKLLDYLSYNARNDKISVWYITQNPVSIPKRHRTQLSLTISMPIEDTYMDMMRDGFMGAFPSISDLQLAYGSLKKYHALVYDRVAFNQKKSYFLFSYKAPAQTPHFIVCNMYYWREYYKRAKLTDRMAQVRALVKETERLPKQKAKKSPGGQSGTRKRRVITDCQVPSCILGDGGGA